MKPQDAWNATYYQLELQLDRASFDTWVRQTELLEYEDGVYVIGVRNNYAKDMLQYRLYRNIYRVLSDVTGESVELRFEVRNPDDRPRFTNLTPDGEDAPLFRLLQRMQQTSNLPESSATQDDTQSSLFDYVESPQRAALPDTELNPRFTFDRFIVNKSNQIAYEGALAIAERSANRYNPFLIYGGVGLGKTHLLQAIAHICVQKGLRTIYISSEMFTNDLVQAIRNRTTAMFRDKFRQADVLLVDDIQFIGGKESTQEEFFHTFNALVNHNKQIVLGSDRHPSELKTLEDRLKSRFQGGLTVDIQLPEFETRIAIMQMWAKERKVYLSDDVLAKVAERVPNNVRELEGAFNQVVARIQLGHKEINVRKVEATLERFNQARDRVTLDDIITMTAQKFGLAARDLKGKRRAARVNKARQVAMYLCREMTECSLLQIGEAFGGRSHSTVLHGSNKIIEELEEDRVLGARITKIRQAIAGARQ